MRGPVCERDHVTATRRWVVVLGFGWCACSGSVDRHQTGDPTGTDATGGVQVTSGVGAGEASGTTAGGTRGSGAAGGSADASLGDGGTSGSAADGSLEAGSVCPQSVPSSGAPCDVGGRTCSYPHPETR